MTSSVGLLPLASLLDSLELRRSGLDMLGYLLVSGYPGYLRMLAVLLLQLLVVLQGDPLSVPHHTKLLTRTRLPQPEANIEENM
mgnify:CR=1 FL=1